MRRAVLVAFLLMLGSVVLGATVLREPIAWAATPFQNVIVVNDASAPVPVTGQLSVQQQGTADVRVTNASVPVQQQGTASVQAVDRTQLALARAFNGDAQNSVDVSAYREIRVYANVNNCAQPATVVIKSTGGSPQVLDAFPVGCNDVSKTYEVPGQNLLFEWQGNGGQLFVFGRAN